MSGRKQSRGSVVDSFLKTLAGPSASPEELRESQERLRGTVGTEWEEYAQQRAALSTPAAASRQIGYRRGLSVAVPAIAAIVLLVAIFTRVAPPKLAPKLAMDLPNPVVVAKDAAGTPIHFREPVRAEQDSTRTIWLLDGSRIELAPGTGLSIDRGDRSTRIDLTHGAVIVTAMPQGDGHLVVQTSDCNVSVVGTVFSVRAESSGSRVSVFEGRVEVKQGEKIQALLPGQQFSTNPSKTAIPLKNEIAWSGNAPALLAMAAAVAAQQPALLPGINAATGAAASIEGIVVRQGTNEPIAGAELELSRVEGTAASPLAPGVADAFNSILYNVSYSLPAQGAVPPPLLAPEVKYGKTGSDGRFVFRDLKEGKYRLVAIRSGGLYYPVEFGQRDLSQRGLNFPVAAGEAKKDVKIEMVPTGAISGRVVDEDGQPMGHVLVMALTPQERSGEVRLEIERVVLTDERGEYRIFWLGPGKYTVAAVYEDQQRRTIDMAPMAPPGRTVARQRATSPVVIRQLLPDGSSVEEAYGVVYFGGTVDPRAARMIEVQSAETFAGADIPMGAGKMHTTHIRGVVINGDSGQPVNGVSVLAIPRQWRPNALVLEGVSKSDGSFDLAGAFSDSYVLTATSVPFQPGSNVTERSTPQAGYIVLDVAASDVSNVRLVMRGATRLVGHVTIEGRAPSDSDPDLAKMIIGLTRDPDLIAMPQGVLPPPPPPPPATSAGTPPPAGTPNPRRQDPAQVAPNGDFALYASPGDFRLNVVTGIPAGMYVKSIRMGGEDLLRSALHVTGASSNSVEITIGTDGGTITGTVVQSGRAFTNATVALVPDAPNRAHAELYRNTTTDSEGNFRLAGVAPGNYKLFAWEWASTDSWQNADFIRGYEGLGKNIRVSPSGKVEKIQLDVISPRR